jgi:hypothetical protein
MQLSPQKIHRGHALFGRLAQPILQIIVDGFGVVETFDPNHFGDHGRYLSVGMLNPFSAAFLN